MKMYDYSASPRICGDCTDMMMRGPITVTREICSRVADGCSCDCAEIPAEDRPCGTADQWSDSPLAMVSSPYQGFGDVFSCAEEALAHGTLFQNLYLPIKDANGTRGGCV